MKTSAGSITAAHEEAVAAAIDEARRRGTRLRVVGSGGSKSDVTSNRDRLLHLEQPDDLFEVEGEAVTAPAGMTTGRFLDLLAGHGLMLATVGEWRNATLAGAFSTGTHGGSGHHGITATSLRAVRLVDGRGEVRTLRPGDADFRHVGVNLGLLGVITRVTFACEERFALRLSTDVVDFEEYVRDPLAQEARAAFHASIWEPNARRVVRFAADRAPLPARPARRELRFGWRTAIATFLSRRLHFHAAISGRVFHGTARGDAADILSPIDISPRTVQFRVLANGMFQLAAELAIDAAAAGEALTRLEALFRRHRTRLRNPIGIRLTRGDGFSLSPAAGRDTLWLDVFFYNREPFMSELRALAEELGARCHWGKTMLLPPEVVRRQYPEWEAFREARSRFDPDGVFGNAFTDHYGLTSPRADEAAGHDG